jgi:NADH:ubiquinone oxidoreductase subunit 6 (subunit J)
MAQDLTGKEVRAQANNDGLLNTEPAVARGAIISIVGAVATVLVVSGVLDEGQKQTLEENAGTIAVAILLILPILQSIWTRFAVWSPRTAAKVAVENAEAPAGAAPTLMPPP